jgi:hypothetical protein
MYIERQDHIMVKRKRRKRQTMIYKTLHRKKTLIKNDVFFSSDHQDKGTTTVLASFRNGYLDVIVKIFKGYPIPRCTIMFNVCDYIVLLFYDTIMIDSVMDGRQVRI